MSKPNPTIEKDIPTPNKLQVLNAYLQAPVMIPGTSQTESTLNTTRLPGIQMAWIKGEGLLLSIKGVESFIPATNVKIVQMKKD